MEVDKVSVKDVLESLLVELQKSRERMCVMEEKVDYLVLERLELHEEAAVGTSYSFCSVPFS